MSVRPESASARYCRRFCGRLCYRYWPRYCRRYFCRHLHRFCRDCRADCDRFCRGFCHHCCPVFCRRLCLYSRRLFRPRRQTAGQPAPLFSRMMAQLLTLLGIAISSLRLALTALRMTAESQTLWEIAVSFLRLGTTAFGGRNAVTRIGSQKFRAHGIEAQSKPLQSQPQSWPHRRR